MATFNLDTEEQYTNVIIAWTEYCVGIIQDTEPLKQRIQEIDESSAIKEQWAPIINDVLWQFNSSVSILNATEQELTTVILLLMQQLSWE
jgi:hypothetical protein